MAAAAHPDPSPAPPPFTPRLIVFEGIDGSGKTTLARQFCDFLRRNRVDCLYLREPGESVWGLKIRQLADTIDTLPVDEQLNYFIEDRKWDVQHNILPALYRGRSVVLDRYYLSNACYQGAHGLDMQEIIRRNRTFAPEPDLTFIVDVTVETGLARIAKTERPPARLFEQRDFLATVRANYRTITGPAIIAIDGEGSLAEVGAKIARHFNVFFKLDPAFT
jgi:dTMP kinase